MDLLELPVGVLVWKVISVLWVGLFLVTGLWLLFSKKVSETEKRAFWLYFAYAPLGFLYDLIIQVRNLARRKPKE